ncbi:SiaB family protein kinase [Bacteroidota bacterium]
MINQPDKKALIKQDRILFEFEGLIDKQILLDTIAKIEEILNAEGVDKRTNKRLINMSIEALQNLQLHSLPIHESGYDILPTYYLTKTDTCINIIIGNLISKAEQPLLEDKLNKINSLNDEEVKFLYGVIMKQTVVKFSTKGGAGLGLIDMKKKSGNPLEFKFQDVADDASFFSLKICLPC